VQARTADIQHGQDLAVGAPRPFASAKDDPLPPALSARARILRCSARVQVDVITQYFNILLDEMQLRPAN
jgi:hypothetical protein